MGPLTPDYRGNLPVLCVGLSSSTWLPGEVSHTPTPYQERFVPINHPPLRYWGLADPDAELGPIYTPVTPKPAG